MFSTSLHKAIHCYNIYPHRRQTSSFPPAMSLKPLSAITGGQREIVGGGCEEDTGGVTGKANKQ